MLSVGKEKNEMSLVYLGDEKYNLPETPDPTALLVLGRKDQLCSLCPKGSHRLGGKKEQYI